MVQATNIPQIFSFGEQAVRVQLDDLGQPWFNANDVCAALDLVNPHKALTDHVDGDDLTKREVIDNIGRMQYANHINESGLYALIFGSTKETAKRFKKWVTSEVLPAIRRTGSYHTPQAPVVETYRLKQYHYPAVKDDQASIRHALMRMQIKELRRETVDPNGPDYDCPLWRLLDELARDGSDVAACKEVYHNMKRLVWKGSEVGQRLNALMNEFTAAVKVQI